MQEGRAPSDDLRRSTLHGVKWNFLATVATVLGRLLFTFALARLLGPENFGIFAVATVYVAFVVVFLDQGFSVALVQREHLSERDIGSVAWLNVVLGAILAALTVLAAPAVAAFFDTPELTAVLSVLSVTLLLRGLVLVPMAMVRRALRFRVLALAQTAAVLAGGGAGIAAALGGASYWSLVVQTIVTDVVLLAWLGLAVGRTSWRASWSSIRGMWVFSTHLLGASLLWFLGNNADNLLVARFEGATELAFYALAFRLLRLPVQMTASVVTGVALPVLSRLRSDDQRSRAWFLTASSGLALITFPVFALLVVGAEDVVPAVFGQQWSAAVAPLQAMALAGAPMVARMMVEPLATARGRTGLVLRWSALTVGLQVVGYAVGLHLGGMVGVAIALAVVQYATWLPHVRYGAGRLVDLRLRSYLLVLWPAAAASVAAALVWVAVAGGIESWGGPSLVQVAGSAVVALGAYAAVLRLGFPAEFAAAVGLLRQIARREHVEPT